MDPYEISLRRELGLPVPEEEEEGSDLFQPIRTFFGATQGVVPRALSGLFPETYARAQRETAGNLQVSEDAPWYEQAEALPGAGDVLAQTISPETRESLLGRAVGPAARLVGNILGDPTTYTPFIMGKAAKGLAAGTRGAEVLGVADDVARTIPQVAANAGEAARALDTVRKFRISETAKAIAETSPLRSKAYLMAEAIKEAEPLALGSAAAVAYGPEVLRSAWAGAGETLSQIGEGNVEEALVSGANTALMAGLGGLMGKGLIDAVTARRALTRKLVDDGVIPETDTFVGPVRPQSGLASEAARMEFERGQAGPEDPGGFVRVPEAFWREPQPEPAPEPTPVPEPEGPPPEVLDTAQERAMAEDWVRRRLEEPQGVLSQMAPELAPTPITRAPAPRATGRRKGRQGALPFDAEGQPIKSAATLKKERAEAEAARIQALVDDATKEALDDPVVVAQLDEQATRGMRADHQDLLSKKVAGTTKRTQVLEERNLLKAADMEDPKYRDWYNHHYRVALEKLKARFKAHAEGGGNPAEAIREARIDREERAAIQGEEPLVPVVEAAPRPPEPVAAPEPAPTPPAPVEAAPVAPAVTEAPPTPEALVVGETPAPVVEPSVRAAPEVPVAAEVAPKPEGPKMLALLEQAIRHKAKTPEEVKFVEGHPELQGRIRKRLEELDVDGVNLDISTPEGAKRVRDAMHGVADKLVRERREALAAKPKAEPKPEVEPVVRPTAEEPVSPAVASQAGLTSFGGQRRNRETMEGAGGPSKAELQRRAKAEGKGLSPAAKQWLTVLHPNKIGGSARGILERYVEARKTLGPRNNLNPDLVNRFVRYTEEYDKNLAGGMAPADARSAAVKVAASGGDLNAIRTRIGQIETLIAGDPELQAGLARKVTEAAAKVAEDAGEAPPTVVALPRAVTERPVLDAQGKAALRGAKEEIEGAMRVLVEKGAPKAEEFKPLLVGYLQMAKTRPPRLGTGEFARAMSDRPLEDLARILDVPGVDRIRGHAEDLVRAVADKLGISFKEVAEEAAFVPRKQRGRAPQPVQPKEGARAFPDGFEPPQTVGGEAPKGTRLAVGTKGKTRVFVGKMPDGRGWRIQFDPKQRVTDLEGFKADMGQLLKDPLVSRLEDPEGVRLGPGMAEGVTQFLNDARTKLSQEPGPDGEPYWVVNKTPPAGIALMESVDRVYEAEEARTASKPPERLSGAESRERARHYQEDEANGVDAGDGMIGADHDRRMGPTFVMLSVKRAGPVLKAVKGVVEDLVGILNPKTKTKFAGLTTSPYARGLYHESGGDSRIFLNVGDVVYAARDRAEAVDNIVYAMVHEVSHVADTEHGGIGFKSTAQYIEDVVRSTERLEQYRKQVGEALTEDVYEGIKRDLVGRHREARVEINGESWRAAREEGAERGAAGAPAGRAPTQPDQLGGGAKAPPGRGGDGLQRGGAVRGGPGGEARDLRPGAAAREGAAEGPAEGGAARSQGWSDLGENEARIARLESGDEVGGDDAASLIQKLGRDRGLSITSRMKAAEEYAELWARNASDAEIQRMLRSAPDPRERPGVEVGAVNMLVGMEGVGDRAKAKVVAFANKVTEDGLVDRSQPLRFEDVAEDVRGLLGVRTKDEYVRMLKARGGGITPTGVVLLRTIRDEYTRTAEGLSNRIQEAADAGRTEEAIKLFKEFETARQNQAAATVVLMDKVTGVARALAFQKQKGLVMNPREMLKANRRAKLADMLQRSAIGGDEALVKTRVEELLRLVEEVEAGTRGGPELERALRAAMRRPSLFGNTWANFRDKFLEFFKAGLLGWPSEVANIGSNTLLRQGRFLEDSLAAMIDAGLVKVKGGDRAIFLGEAAVATRALGRAMREALPALMREELKLFKFEGGNVAKALQEGAFLEELIPTYGAIPGKFGNFVRFHFDSMQNWDDFFKHLARTDTLYREVYRALEKGGDEFRWLANKVKTGESKADAVERIVGEIWGNHRRAQSPEGMDYDGAMLIRTSPWFKRADEMAKTDTFQANLGHAALGVQNFLSAHPMTGMLVPFFRTPVNIFNETIKRTPWGYVQAARKWSKLSQVERAQELSKPTLGTAIMATVMGYAMMGDVTGGGPLSFEEKEALQATGWQPYSIRVGDQWISYQRFEPLSSIVGMAADAVEAWRKGERGTELAQKVADSIAENLTNKTFLSGLSNLTGAISDPKQELANFVKQTQASLVPNSLGFAPFGHLARAMDPVFRQQESMTLDPIIAKVPFLSETLPPSYGPTGEERQRPGGFAERLVSPVARRAVQTGPLARGSEELVRVSAVPKSPLRYWTSPQGFRVPLKPEERQLLAKALQEATTLVGQRLVNDPYYQSLPKDELDPRYRYGQMTQQDMVKKLVGKYRYRALERIKPALKARSREAYQERGV